MKLYKRLAQLLGAIENCKRNGNETWLENHTATVETLVKNFMPSGSGFDSGTHLDLYKSTPEKLIFHSAYHHMDDSGCYDGWSEFHIVVTPSLQFDFNIKIIGHIKQGHHNREYILDTFHYCLDQDNIKGEN